MDSASVAAAFARALDHDDYEAAGRLLAEDCAYHTGSGDVVRGRDAVLAPYRQTSEKGKRTFDEVGYLSEVESSSGSSATVLYTDHLRRGEHRHEFQCRQIMEVGEGGLIVRIQHQEIDGQRAALNAFFERAGITW